MERVFFPLFKKINNMKLFTFLLSFTCLAILSKAQFLHPICAFDDSIINYPEPPPASCNSRADELMFRPNINELVKVVDVNFVFIQKNDGSGNFQENNAEHQKYIDDLINRVNYTFSNVGSVYDTRCYNGTDTLISDTKIRINVNRLYIKKSSVWDNKNTSSTSDNYMCPAYNNWYLRPLTDSLANVSTALNVFFTESKVVHENFFDNGDCGTSFSETDCSQYPSFYNYGQNSRVHMRNEFVKYEKFKQCLIGEPSLNYPTWETLYGWLTWGQGGLIAHELGHSFDLRHVVPNVNDKCTTHVMNNTAASSFQFLSPIEIGKMNRSLSQTNMRNYVKANIFSETPEIINQNRVHNYNARKYRGIEIVNSSELEITCELLMPITSSITINNGSILKLSNGSELSVFGEGIGTVLVKNGAELTISDEVNINDFVIKVENGGVLNVSSSSLLTIAGSARINVQSGGKICINNGASITLDNKVNIIQLCTGFLTTNSGCVSDFNNFPTLGYGSINYSSNNPDIILGNLIINTDKEYVGKNIYVNDVDVGNYSDIKVLHSQDFWMTTDFELELGSTFETINNVCE